MSSDVKSVPDLKYKLSVVVL